MSAPLNHEARRAADLLFQLIGGPDKPQTTREGKIIESLASFLACCVDELPSDGSEPEGLPNVIGGLIRNVLGGALGDVRVRPDGCTCVQFMHGHPHAFDCALKRRTLTSDQLAALREFAAVNGHNWKMRLNAAWSTGRYRDYAGTAHSGALQQIRNAFGPSWLVRFSFDNVKTHTEVAS